MGRIAKLIGIVLVAVVVLIVGAGIFIGMFFDPNDYKDQITAAVEGRTGRELTLEGDLELEIFPTIRIALGSASLSNAAGFPDVPFARIDEAELQLALLPLLSKRIEISQARLAGLELNLARNAQGRNNWQDLSGRGTAPADSSAASGSGATAIDLDVGAVSVSDARVSWRDAATGSDWTLDDFRLDATNFGSGTAFPLEMGFNLTGEQIEVSVVADMQATLSLDTNVYRLADLEIEIEGQGPGWPGGAGEASASFDAFIADLNAATVDLENLQLEILGMNISGNLEGRQLFTNLTLQGGIEIDTFNPQDLLDAFDAKIQTADSDVLRRASASATFNYSNAGAGLSNMRLGLDDSQLTGSIGLNGNALRFDLNVDSINIDRYLPPAKEQEIADEGSLDEVDLPIEPLRNFVASGKLALRETQFMGLKLTDASFDLQARNGRMTITPRASLYGGSYSGTIGLAVNGDAATLTLAQNFKSLDLMPFANDYLGSEMLSGTGDLNLDVSATGSNLGEMRRALDGAVSFAFSDGAWEGIDVWYELRRARAVLDGNSAPARPAGARRTPFSSIAASGSVEDAVLSNQDLNATLPFMTVSGGGTVNLLNDAMNFELVARFVDSPLLQEDPAMANLAGAELPLSVTGTLTAPSIKPDFGAMVRARVRSEAQGAIEEERENLRDRVRDRLRGILE